MSAPELTPIFTRREALAVVRSALWSLVARLDDDDRLPALAPIYQMWDERLLQAARTEDDESLSLETAEAIFQTVHRINAHAHAGTDAETLAEWLDLLPRNVLALVNAESVFADVNVSETDIGRRRWADWSHADWGSLALAA